MADDALTRSAALTGFVDTARALGLDPYRMARNAGLPPACLTDPDLKVSAALVGRLLKAAAERSGAEDFGLRLAERRNLSNLGAIGLVIREQPTLRRALETLAAHLWAHNQALALRIERAGEVVVLSESMLGPGSGGRQANELTIGVLVRILRRFLGAAWRPEAVAFTHPPPGDLATHRRVLGVTPLFGQTFNGVVITAAEFDAPIPDADPAAARDAQRYFDSLAFSRRDDPVGAVRELIVALLPGGGCSVERVAAHMGLDRRTLHRRLAARGTTFTALLEAVREELMAVYEADGRRSLTEIADLLGYGSLSAFSRWRRGRR